MQTKAWLAFGPWLHLSAEAIGVHGIGLCEGELTQGPRKPCVLDSGVIE